MTPMPSRLVAYHRVSTARQGRSGLGLEAQKAAIERLAVERAAEVIATFTEIESGQINSRPELAAALHLARITGATLAIAKLDRLSRNAAFLLTLRDSGVRFIAADMPEDLRPRWEVMATPGAEWEALKTSKRDYGIYDAFVVTPPKRLDICTLPVPARPVHAD